MTLLMKVVQQQGPPTRHLSPHWKPAMGRLVSGAVVMQDPGWLLVIIFHVNNVQRIPVYRVTQAFLEAVVDRSMLMAFPLVV